MGPQAVRATLALFFRAHHEGTFPPRRHYGRFASILDGRTHHRTSARWRGRSRSYIGITL